MNRWLLLTGAATTVAGAAALMLCGLAVLADRYVVVDPSNDKD